MDTFAGSTLRVQPLQLGTFLLNVPSSVLAPSSDALCS